MIETLILIVAGVYLLITSILDIKLRLVYDYINYSFGAIFLILRMIQYMILPNNSLLIEIGITFALTVIIGLILYKLGAWGGGDLKLLGAICIGIYSFSFDKQTLLTMNMTTPFYVNFLINTLFAGIIFSIIWSFIFMIKNRKKVIKKMNLFHKIVFAIILILFITLFFVNTIEKLFVVTLIIFSSYYIIKIFEDEITIIDKSVKKLDEGDWILQDMKVGRKTIKKTPIGLSKEDINILQKSKLKTIKIKDGVPFVVSFALAFLMTLILNSNLVEIIVTSI